MTIKKSVENWMVTIFTAITFFVLLSNNHRQIKSNEQSVNEQIISALNQYANPDTLTYNVESVEIKQITSEVADSLVLTSLCRNADYWSRLEDTALLVRSEWKELADEYYEMKDYDSYKAVLFKVDSCLSRADEFEGYKLELEKAAEDYKLGCYGNAPLLTVFSLVSEVDTINNNWLVLTSDLKTINHKPNGN